MATIVKLHELEGLAYEEVFLNETSCFKHADLGVSGDDVAAALILKDQGETDLLSRLYSREIRCVVPVDEDSRFEDLEFEPIEAIEI